MMFSRIILGLLVFFCVSHPVEAAQKLSSAQIQALAPGHYVGTWKGKRQLNLRLSPNGTVAGTLDGRYHSGRWYVSGGKLCLVFKILILEKTKCGAIHRDGNWLIGYYKKGRPRIRLRPVDASKA
ncbi:MAG TPA: hypothetical protein VIB38_06350 [Aestuariivirgaceae bacterium]|jgi:hypothetical protein